MVAFAIVSSTMLQGHFPYQSDVKQGKKMGNRLFLLFEIDFSQSECCCSVLFIKIALQKIVMVFLYEM